MPCPFRVVLILVSCILALGAAYLALLSPIEHDEEGNEIPRPSIRVRMSAWFEEAVRPYLPLSMGGVKRLSYEEFIMQEEAQEEELRRREAQQQGDGASGSESVASNGHKHNE